MIALSAASGVLATHVISFGHPLRHQAQAPSPEQLEDLQDWTTTIRNPAAPMEQRVFNARKLLQQDWPDAVQAVHDLLSNAGGTASCIPVCRALAQNGAAGERYTEPLLALITDPDEEVRRHAGIALGALDVPECRERLLATARDDSADAKTRAAAVEALARLRNSKLAAEILIGLLVEADPAITGAIARGLAHATSEDFGTDPKKWRDWWEQSRDLSSEQWLQNKLTRLDDRLQGEADERAAIEQRLAQALEQNYRLTGNGERMRLLETYLSDPLPIVRQLALDFVHVNIGEGKLPDEGLAEAIRRRMDDDCPKVRKSVLSVLGHLRHSADAEAIVRLLAGEGDEEVRLSALETLGKLSNAAAVPALIDELERPGNSAACMIAAAKALGSLYTRGKEADSNVSPVIDILIAQYNASASNPPLRLAILRAMSSIAQPAFASMLLENLSHAQAEVRLRCTKGLADMGIPGHVVSILPLLEDPDGGVRREAAAAIGRLSQSGGHLALLFNRLPLEENAATREALRAAFIQIWQAQSREVQTEWIQKGAAQPASGLAGSVIAPLQLELLKKLEEQLTGPEQSPGDSVAIRRSIATCYEQLGRYDDAVRQWQAVQQLLASSDIEGSRDAALCVLRGLLRSGPRERCFTHLRTMLNDGGHPHTRICDEILAFLAELKNSGPDQLRPFVNDLKTAFPELIDPAFKQRLAPYEAEAKPSAASDTQTTAPNRLPGRGESH